MSASSLTRLRRPFQSHRSIKGRSCRFAAPYYAYNALYHDSQNCDQNIIHSKESRATYTLGALGFAIDRCRWC